MSSQDLKSKEGFSLFSKKRKSFIAGSITLVLILAIAGLFFYYNNTELAPAPGGSYKEGLVGTPRHINPIYAPESESNRDISELLFSGLMDYNSNNELEPFLAESVETENHENFEVTIREAEWSDGKKITAEDVLFTVEKIQSQSVGSPLRVGWEDIEVEKVSERKVEFHLDGPSPLFLEKLTLAPIPKHIWEEVPEDDFQYSDHNLNPISSGPYQLEEREEEEGNIEEVILKPNPRFFGKEPYIEEVNFKFFESEGELLKDRDNLDGYALPSIKNEISNSHKSYQYQLPRYFGVFFNLEKVNEDLRKALAYGTNKEKLLTGLEEKTEKVSSPVLPDFYELKEPEVSYKHNPEKASELLKKEYTKNEEGYFEEVIQEEDYFEFTERLSEDDQGEEVRRLQECFIEITDEEKQIYPDGDVTGYFGEEVTEAVNRFQEEFREEILEPHGFTEPTGIVAESTREKLNEFCGGEIPEIREVVEVEIATISHPLLTEMFNRLEDQWSELGVKAKRNSISLANVENRIITERNFESFLFGVSMKSIPDPYRWWHSRQVEPPGLNLTGYQNEEADELLQKARTETEDIERRKALEELQDIILEEKPAIFLYNPGYIYLVDEKVKGVEEGKIINPSQRLGDITSWYINTKRSWKNN